MTDLTPKDMLERLYSVEVLIDEARDALENDGGAKFAEAADALERGVPIAMGVARKCRKLALASGQAALK